MLKNLHSAKLAEVSARRNMKHAFSAAYPGCGLSFLLANPPQIFTLCVPRMPAQSGDEADCSTLG